MTSEPNREMSNLGAAVAIISMAQQEMPIGMGQSEFFLAQEMTESRVVVIIPSPNALSNPNGELLSSKHTRTRQGKWQ
jgi:hypothetical protein